jgi:hypothetical protein
MLKCEGQALNLQNRVGKLEEQAARFRRVAVEDLTDEQLEAMAKSSGYDLTRLSNAELTALHDCYTDTGEYLAEKMTPELAGALERVKL